MTSPRTKSGTRKLSDVAQKVVVPKGVTSTGWPSVRDKCTDLGITFRPWQDGAGRLILAKRADGKYAATIGGTGMSIPRQVGKTFLVGAIVFALCLLRPGLTVIWTAHRVRTAEETFGKMQAFAKRRKIKPHILRVILGSGEEAILFRNDSRILFGAREGGFGLGFDEVDVVIFDEAQRLRDMTLDDMIPATNQSRQETGALLLFMGTPPRPTDAGEVFTRMRTDATTGEDDDTGWIEFGADPGYAPPLKPAPLTEADWKQVAKANPSYPEDTPREAILRMRKQLTDDSFTREGLGVWDDEDDSTGDLDFEAWKALADPAAERGKQVAFGLYVAEDRSAWIAVAWKRPDGHTQVQLVDRDPVPAYRLVDRCKALVRDWNAKVVPPPKEFEEELEAAGVDIEKMPPGAYVAACGAFEDAFKAAELHHGNQEAFNRAVQVARWRIPPSGEKTWQIKDSPDVGPLVAATRALYGLARLVDNPFNIW